MQDSSRIRTAEMTYLRSGALGVSRLEGYSSSDVYGMNGYGRDALKVKYEVIEY